MDESPSRYTSKGLPEEVRRILYGSSGSALRNRLPKALRARSSFARVTPEEALAFGKIFDPAATLLLGVLRLSGTNWAKCRDGWMSFDREMLEELGLTNKDARYRAVRRLLACNAIEIRHTPGSRLEYRLRPGWPAPKAEVVDLAAPYKSRGKR